MSNRSKWKRRHGIEPVKAEGHEPLQPIEQRAGNEYRGRSRGFAADKTRAARRPSS